MKRIAVVLVAVCIAVSALYAVTARAYVTDLKTWGAEVLTPTDLNGNFSKLNVGLDNLLLSVGSVAADSSDARFPGTFPIPFGSAVIDSSTASDSVTVFLTTISPIGNKGVLYVKNTTGLSQTVSVFLDFLIRPETSILDSIRVPVWTETTNTENYVAVAVYDDSTETYFRTGATASTASVKSATARTTAVGSVTTINLTGGPSRLKLTIYSKADSLFIGEPTAYITKP
jgi:hypothetical protein